MPHSLLRDKTALVTGAGGGIGYETALSLARMGAQVFVHARSAASAAAAVQKLRAAASDGKFTPVHGDFSDLIAVRKLAEDVRAQAPKLDILVNNAGCMTADWRATAQGHEMQFGVNHLAPWLLTKTLLPSLVAAQGRIVNVSSMLHGRAKFDLDDVMLKRGKYNGMRAYANSKLCNILMATALTPELQAKGVTINSLHPGVVATEIARNSWFGNLFYKVAAMFMLTPAQGARTSIYLASDAGLAGRTGGYYVNCQQAAPSATSQDTALAQKLRALSDSLVTAV